MKYLLIFLSALILVALIAILFRDNWTLVFQTFFNAKKVNAWSEKYYEDALAQRLKEKSEYEAKGWTNVTAGAVKVRNQIFRSFFIIVLVYSYSLSLGIAFKCMGFEVSDFDISLFQVIAVLTILWALLAYLGYELQTIKGLTAPEYVNGLWFRTLNVISGYFILICFSLPRHSK